MDRRRLAYLETLARVGFAARGVVYALVGALALMAAIGSGGGVGGGKSAFRDLLAQPFGVALLALVGAGLVCYALWRIVEGLSDADGHGSSPKGLATRALHVGGGVFNGGLAVSAFTIAFGLGAAGGDDDAAQDWTAFALDHAFGRWIVAAVGAAVIAGGAFYALKAIRGDVLKRLSVPAARVPAATALGRAGYAARGLTFALIGLFLIVAALHGDSDQAKGLGGALEVLQRQPFGWLPLSATALGLFAFGAFGAVQALYRRIRMPGLDDARRALGGGARSHL